MTILNVSIDDRTEETLLRLSEAQGVGVSELASRLLARAARAARPRPAYDPAELAKRNAEFAAEDLALAESGAEEQVEFLDREDRE